MSAGDNLSQLFSGLCALYQTQVDIGPHDVLVTDTPDDLRETLLVREDGDALSVALLLDGELLASFQAAPQDAALRHDFASSLPIIEGLSHLLYVAESARCEHELSGLELETQAEVDKLAVHTLDRWPLSRAEFDGLRRRLYRDFELREGLSADLRARYLAANEIAARFSEQLGEVVASRALPDFRQILRGFWRGGLREKHALAA